jgi:cytochrome b6-f complex subunit 5
MGFFIIKNPFFQVFFSESQSFKIFWKIIMVESLLSGIVLGLVPVTIAGLLVTAYLQYRRGDSLNF